MSALLWATVLLPAPAGVVLMIRGRTRARSRGSAGAVGVAVAAATFALALAAAFLRPAAEMDFFPGGPLRLAVDGLSAVVVVTVAAVALLVLLFSTAEVDAGRGRFFGLMLVFEAAVLLTATATTLTGLLLAWEVMGATSYALIAFHWRQDESVSAGMTAFLTTRAGDLGLYLAAGAALAGGVGTGTPLALGALPELHGPWLDLAAAGVLAAALGKAAQLPFSFWLSRAMLGPSPVSALLHSAAMVAMGGYLLLRLHPLLQAAGWATHVAAWAGALTALLLGAVAVGLRDLKQLLAASTSAQLGFVVLAAGSGAIAGGTAHFVAHAATKSLLFLCAGAWLTALGTQQLPELRGVARRQRLLGTVFAVGALALAGVPPLSLWATKDEILAALQAPALHGVVLAAELMSALYAGKAVAMVLRPAAATGVLRPSGRTKAPVAVAVTVLAVAAAAGGVLAFPPAATWLRDLLAVPAGPSAGLATMLATAALALAGTTVAAIWAPRIPEASWAWSWLGLERATDALLVRPTLRLAHLLARFDDAVLDRAVLALAPGVRRLAWWAADADRRAVDAAVEQVAAGTRRLGGLARRPQTGQLHQYYAQAVVLLGAAMALLLFLLLR
ncbi:MAG TPA: proton-conducting transporter membrane subunit [Streptomyces sp.]|nr:proton-conducting transporter membrane subunit [Streptomyces sp.]